MVSSGCREKRTRPAERPPERKCTRALLSGDAEEEGLFEGAVLVVVEDVEDGCLTPTAGAKALRRRG